MNLQDTLVMVLVLTAVGYATRSVWNAVLGKDSALNRCKDCPLRDNCRKDSPTPYCTPSEHKNQPRDNSAAKK